MKHLLLSVLLAASLYSTFAQAPGDTGLSVQLRSEPRFFINFHGGYAMALGSTFKFYPDDISSINMRMADNNVISKDVNYKAPTKGLGEGFRFGGGVSYVLNDFINLGLDVDYFRSTISKVRDSTFAQTFSTGLISTHDYSERNTISYDASLLTFTPNITLKAISRPKWFLYNKIGAVITFRPNSIENDTHHSVSSMGWQGYSKDSVSNTETRYSWVIKNPSIGFTGAIGAQFKITERIRIFGEIQFSHIVFVVSRREVTSYNVDGSQEVNNLTVNEKEIDFEKNFRTDTWIADPNKPDKAVTQRIPITYVGLQAGLVYRF